MTNLGSMLCTYAVEIFHPINSPQYHPTQTQLAQYHLQSVQETV